MTLVVLLILNLLYPRKNGQIFVVNSVITLDLKGEQLQYQHEYNPKKRFIPIKRIVVKCGEENAVTDSSAS